MPAVTRLINSHRVKIRHRIYDTKELNPYRGKNTGIAALKNQWEIHYDPYDVTRVWVRSHQDGGWITAFWRQLYAAPEPFGDDIWEQGRLIVANRGISSPSEAIIKAAVDDLLTRASPNAPKPSKASSRERRAAARNRATKKPGWPQPPKPSSPPTADTPPVPEAAPTSTPDDTEDDARQLAKIVPLKIYDPQKEAEKWW